LSVLTPSRRHQREFGQIGLNNTPHVHSDTGKKEEIILLLEKKRRLYMIADEDQEAEVMTIACSACWLKLAALFWH
jgi:hypothetical protein